MTTQPYTPSTTTVQPYFTYKQPEHTSTTTESSNKYNYYSTTRKPFSYYTQKSTTVTQPSKVTYPASINKYSISTTKSPYNFQDYTKAKVTERNDQPRRHGFYTKEEFDSYFGRTTTKSPYPDKGIRSLFKIGTYYSQAKSSDNSIRPDASQQVQIEPARLVYSYQRNLTTGEIIQN